MGRLARVSNVKIHKERGKDKVKQAEFEDFPGVIRRDVNGTPAGALEVRGIATRPEKLEAVAEGRREEIE